MDNRGDHPVFPLLDTEAPGPRVDLVLPFEFVIQGPPRSAQTHNRAALRRWKNMVQETALLRLPVNLNLFTGKLRMKVVLYHEGPTSPLDIDNMIKPIRDALNGVVYEDDAQVVDTAMRATSINGAFIVRGMSVVLAEGFCRGDEFLHVVIEPAPNHQELLR